ncbi:Scr1 family TA system antitoxin-like transcriptional regulator [Streptomyces sp. NPDC086776]|uniref:Scr1 family TA system antitoxin-like transcriptional regulator n=1 Tax=Streptomyces sp. NPDC086776 TaxID=3365756 RepID=UPI003819AE45
MALNTAAMAARKRFGNALQEARKTARLTTGEAVQQRDVAKALGYKSYNRVSQMERGLTWPKDNEWKILVKVLDMDLTTRVRLETMIAEGKATAGAWWTEFEGEFPESLLQFVAFEDAAQRITTCAANVLPSLLQTERYARSLTTGVAGSVLTADAVERSVALRRNRRHVFTKPNPAVVEFIFSEAALRQEAGGKELMLEQLEALIEDGSSRTVSLRVVPFTAVATSMYMVHLLEFGGADEHPLTAFDSMTGMTFQKRPKEVRESRYYIEAMRKLACSHLETMAMIKKIQKEMSSA